MERTARKESWKETSKREGGEKMRMRKAARASVWSKFRSRLSKMEKRKVITMMAARITEIPPPAMNAYRTMQGIVRPAAHFLTEIERRRNSERFNIQMSREKERRATIPNWSPEMAKR